MANRLAGPSSGRAAAALVRNDAPLPPLLGPEEEVEAPDAGASACCAAMAASC